MSTDTIGQEPPLDYAPSETDDPEDYEAPSCADSIVGALIVFTLFLALYGLVDILRASQVIIAQ